MTAASPALRPTHLDSLADDGRRLLSTLAGRGWTADFYLAGSAALALYVAHRRVHGLDLMSASHRLTSPQRRDLLADLLDADPELRVETARDGFLYARSGAGAALRLFHYPYPLVAPLEEAAGLRVASALDLGLMKVAAIISRGTRRDFADLCLLCRRLPLAAVLAGSAEKFGHVRDFPLQALKGLADLEQAAGDPMPRLAVPLTWDDVRAWVDGEVRTLARRHVGLPTPPPTPDRP